MRSLIEVVKTTTTTLFSYFYNFMSLPDVEEENTLCPPLKNK